jgi:hypothetical protein
MNPNQDGRHFMLLASGLFLRPGNPGNSMPGNSSLSPAARSTDPGPPGPAENKSPYPGINIGTGSELLDFRFEDTEILQEGEE